MTTAAMQTHVAGSPKVARHALEEAIERLLRILDAMDGDPDLELEDEYGGDIVDEPHDEETDCNLAGGGTDLEFDHGEYDGPGFIWAATRTHTLSPLSLTL